VLEVIEFYSVDPAADASRRKAIEHLLSHYGLDLDAHVPLFVVGEVAGRIVACAGLDGDVVECVAIDEAYQGGALSCSLLTEVTALAAENGHTHLFLFTRPTSATFFRGCGFYPLAEAPGLAVLMENTPIGIRSYCDRLRALRRPGKRIGAIVMNANPFTLGHQYLARVTSQACDWVHVFMVGEDRSQFAYRDRFRMAELGLASMGNITLHEGSPYIISRATFPDYFLKEKQSAAACCMAIDLKLFRDHIAPALGITDRFVGTEPYCVTTQSYNRAMAECLQQPGPGAPGLAVVEVERLTSDGRPISASEVRRLLASGDFAGISRLVPRTTLAYLSRLAGVDQMDPAAQNAAKAAESTAGDGAVGAHPPASTE
jgi:[citrate (pro-3S)-lyase] ligase